MMYTLNPGSTAQMLTVDLNVFGIHSQIPKLKFTMQSKMIYAGCEFQLLYLLFIVFINIFLFV